MCLTATKHNLKQEDRRKYQSCKKEQKDKNIKEI